MSPGKKKPSPRSATRGRTGEMRERIFEFMRERLAHNHPPSVREVQEALGLSAVQTAREHLERLVTDNRLTKHPGIARGYRLPRSTSKPTLLVPILGRVAAGALSEAIEEADGHVTIEIEPHGASTKSLARRTRELFALRVRGESMRDAGILHGDVVIVERVHGARPETLDGEIVVAQLDGEATVKTLRRHGATIELVPANPDFQTIRVPSGAELELLGRVIEVRRYLKPARASAPSPSEHA